jgi:hypothetical protein
MHVSPEAIENKRRSRKINNLAETGLFKLYFLSGRAIVSLVRDDIKSMKEILIQRMERRATPRHNAPVWTAERRERAIWLLFLEARAYKSTDPAEAERLMDVAANYQRELDEVYA